MVGAEPTRCSGGRSPGVGGCFFPLGYPAGSRSTTIKHTLAKCEATSSLSHSLPSTIASLHKASKRSPSGRPAVVSGQAHSGCNDAEHFISPDRPHAALRPPWVRSVNFVVRRRNPGPQ
jgi:hypothetical protein